MLRLLYISTSRQQPTPEMLADVLRASRRSNAAVDVSGLLIVGGRRFLQALEGPDVAVLSTYQRISKDPRHFAIVELAREQISERQFSQWSIGGPGGRSSGRHGVDLAGSRGADRTDQGPQPARLLHRLCGAPSGGLTRRHPHA